MSDCPHKHGYSHCTECCDESIAETERQLACAEATAQAQAYRANTSEERVGEQTKRIVQLIEALTLAKGFMQHLDWCGLVRHHDPPYFFGGGPCSASSISMTGMPSRIG